MQAKYIYRTVEVTEAGDNGKKFFENPLNQTIKVVKVWGLLEGTNVKGQLVFNDSKGPDVKSDIQLTSATFDGDVRKAIDLDMVLEPKDVIEIKVVLESGTFDKLTLVFQIEVQ